MIDLDSRTQQNLNEILRWGPLNTLNFRRLSQDEREEKRKVFNNAHNQLQSLISAYESYQAGDRLDQTQINRITPLLMRNGIRVNELHEHMYNDAQALQMQINEAKILDNDIDRVLQNQFRSTCEKVTNSVVKSGKWLYKKSSPVVGLASTGIKLIATAAIGAAALGFYYGHLHLPFRLPYFG